MSQRIFLIEPKQLKISRLSAENIHETRPSEFESNEDNGKQTNERLVRSAGDGMEFSDQEDTSQIKMSRSWQQHQAKNLPKPIATSTPAPNKGKREKRISSRNAKEIIEKLKTSDDKVGLIDVDIPTPDLNLNLMKEVEDLKLKIINLEETQERLVEQKVKISTQLGIQTQVNSELKTLLVASVGQDLEEKLEKMTLKNALTERKMNKFESQIDERQEELEIATIQSDVWRSKFLATRVMADELASWKAVTDAKYRECNAALETLLEEHRQLTTTIASANRFLLRLSKLSGCESVSDDVTGNSSIDLAIANHSLSKRLTEKAIHHVFEIQEKGTSANQSSVYQSCDKSVETKEIQNSSLSTGEKRAVIAIKEASTGHPQLDKRKKDFLAHSRISHILATRYPMTCLVCKGCKGPLKVV